MNDKKSTGSFSKVRKLVTVLKKSNGKGVVGDSGALISPRAARILVYCGLLAIACALFAAVYWFQPFLARVFPLKGLTPALMLILLVMSFVLALKDLVTVLYSSDDLALLLPMPFSAGQIVMAKLAVVSVFPVWASFILLNAVCLGLGIRAGAGVPFIIGTVLSSLLIPITGIAAATLLVVIVFRIFGFIRNRDAIVALSGIFTFGLTFVYIYFSSSYRGGEAGEAAAAVGAVSSVSMAFPNIRFMNRFMFEGSIPGLLISLAVPAVLAVLAMLAVRAFYFNTALSMQNTGTKKKALTRADLHTGKKKGVRKALTGYEAKSARRNPAFWIYGFAMSFVWPVLFALPILLGQNDFLGLVTFPLNRAAALACFMTLALTASCFSCGFNILPGSAFSREGASFAVIRSLPVDFKDYYRSKRNFSLLICSLGSVLYVVLIGIVCIAAGFISIADSWAVPAAACACFLLDLILVSLMLLRDCRKPRLNWDSDTVFARKLGLLNIIAVVLGVLMLTAFLAAVAVLPMLHDAGVERIVLIICAAVELVLFVLGTAVNHFAVRKGAQNLMNLEP